MEPQEIVYTSPKNFNSELGLILSLFCIETYEPGMKSVFGLVLQIMYLGLFGKKKYDVIVLEYGIDHPWDMDFLVSVTKPDISIFTKLDYTHREFFWSKEEIGHEKFKLMHNTKVTTFLNAQDDFCKSECDNILIDVEKYFRASDISKYTLKHDSETGAITSQFTIKGHSIESNLIGKTNAQYMSLGFRILKEIGWEPKEPHINLEFHNQPGRWSFLAWVHDSILIDSSYNAGPESMKQAIADTNYLKKKLFPGYKIGYILWDMRELGPESSTQHKIVFRAAIEHADFIISIWSETQKYFSQAAQANTYNGIFKTTLNAKQAADMAKEIVESDTNKYLIMVKWSQNTIFSEEAVAGLLKDPNNISLLCRQEDYWKKAKEYFFGSLKK